MRSLHGHVNWVKNIEYSRREQYLATSGFDGAVFLWDINRHSEDEVSYYKLMSMRQVPLERDINIAVNGYSGFATSTQKGPFMAMLISHSRGTYLIAPKEIAVQRSGAI